MQTMLGQIKKGSEDELSQSTESTRKVKAELKRLSALYETVCDELQFVKQQQAKHRAEVQAHLTHMDVQFHKAKQEMIVLARQITTVNATMVNNQVFTNKAIDFTAADVMERGALTANLTTKLMAELDAQRRRCEELEEKFESSVRALALNQQRDSASSLSYLQQRVDTVLGSISNLNLAMVPEKSPTTPSNAVESPSRGPQLDPTGTKGDVVSGGQSHGLNASGMQRKQLLQGLSALTSSLPPTPTNDKGTAPASSSSQVPQALNLILNALFGQLNVDTTPFGGNLLTTSSSSSPRVGAIPPSPSATSTSPFFAPPMTTTSTSHTQPFNTPSSLPTTYSSTSSGQFLGHSSTLTISAPSSPTAAGSGVSASLPSSEPLSAGVSAPSSQHFLQVTESLQASIKHELASMKSVIRQMKSHVDGVGTALEAQSDRLSATNKVLEGLQGELAKVGEQGSMIETNAERKVLEVHRRLEEYSQSCMFKTKPPFCPLLLIFSFDSHFSSS